MLLVGRGEAGQGQVDDRRVSVPHARGVETEPDQGAWGEVLDQHVARGDQSVSFRQVGGVVQIEHDPTLAGVEDCVGLSAPSPAVGRVHVHHLGAVVGQQSGGGGPGHPLTEVHDLDAVQGTRAVRHGRLLARYGQNARIVRERSDRSRSSSTLCARGGCVSAVRSKTVQSVDRAVALLRAIADTDADQSLADLALRCGLERPTAWRLLWTLESNGLVEKVEPSHYRLATGWQGLSRRHAEDSLARLAHPVLEQLALEHHVTASLVLVRRFGLEYVDQVGQPTLQLAPVGRRALPARLVTRQSRPRDAARCRMARDGRDHAGKPDRHDDHRPRGARRGAGHRAPSGLRDLSG